LKIGRFEIKLAESKQSPKQEFTKEVGGTGTTYFGGQLAENEYNADLKGSKGRAIYEKMRKSDGQVKAALLACKLPVLSASWAIEPASEDPADVDIAGSIESNLFDGMTVTWDNFLSHSLLMLDFGFMIFEKVFELVDGKYQWRKLAPRLPNTVFQWHLDDNGGLQGIQQAVYKGTQYEFIDIPVEKLLVFTNNKEGANFEGESILRAAYKHWYYKDNLYRIDAMAAERHALGVPFFQHPADAKTEDKSRIDELGQRLYAHEQAYIRLAEGYEFDIKGLSGTIKDILPSINEHNRQIAMSVLADFMVLGTADVGSYALSRDKSSFFLLSLNAVAKNICDTFNRYAIPQLVDLNYNVTDYPQLTYSGLGMRDIGIYAKAVTDLITAGALTPTPDIEDVLRDMLSLQAKPEEEPGQPAQQTEKRIFKGAEPKYSRDLTFAEKFVALDEIEKRLNDAEQAIVKAASDVQKKQIEKLGEVALRIVERKQLSRLEDIDVPFRAEMSAAIGAVLLDLFNYGRQQVKKELAGQMKAGLAEPEPINPEALALISEFLKTRAKASVNILSTKLRSALTFEALRQIKQGIVDHDALLKVMNDLSNKELLATASYSVNEAFNFGRSSQAAEDSEDIDRVQYSSILDKNVCLKCEPLDGEEWDYDDPRTERYARGNPDCEGGNRCRCMEIYIAKSERRNR